jgi:hypothetical protein
MVHPLAPVGSLPRHRSTFVDGASEESLRALALAAQRHHAACSHGSPPVVGLEVLEPGFDCGFAETSIPAESDMRYPARPSLRPDPVSLHAEKLSNLISRQQFVHDRSFPRGVVKRPAECRGRVACRERARSSAVVAHPPRGCLISLRSCLSSNLGNCGSPGRYRAGRRMGGDVDGNLQIRRRESEIPGTSCQRRRSSVGRALHS